MTSTQAAGESNSWTVKRAAVAACATAALLILWIWPIAGGLLDLQGTPLSTAAYTPMVLLVLAGLGCLTSRRTRALGVGLLAGVFIAFVCDEILIFMDAGPNASS